MYQSLYIYVSIWDSSSDPSWRSNDEIYSFMNNNSIDLKIIYSYFDFDDFDNPVKTYVGDADVSSILKFLKMLLCNYSYKF